VGLVRFSSLAESDLFEIGAYTLRTWGEVQTIRYLEELEVSCRYLADHPSAGRSCEEIRPGLYRHEQGKHVIFFRRDDAGIVVSRILHQRRLPEIHPFEES